MKFKHKILTVVVGLIALIAIAGTALPTYYDGFFTNILAKGEAYITTTLTVAGDAILPTGSIGEGEIEDRIYRIPVPLAGVFVDGTGPITSASAPNLTTVDNVGAIVYDNSGETAEIQFPWYPDTYYTGMTVNLTCTSSNATGSAQAVDWSIFVHGNDVDIPTAIAQTGASLTSATLDASEELVTLTLDATGIAAITAGSSGVTVAVWNNGSSNNTLEIKKIYLGETR